MSDVLLDRKVFAGTMAPKWCPGCGNHGIFKSLTKVFARIGRPPEEIAVISGIGCSSRLPYYLATYGFHTLHGRAPTVALGVKLARPDLAVWVVSGDGDALAIGGNHFIHFARHNPDIKMIILNNQIYGLTKGQASPTSRLQQETKSTPRGVIERPFSAIALALAAGAGFVARTIDTHLDHVEEVLYAASQHKGAAIVEILTNCVIFNDGAFAKVEDPEHAADLTVKLRSGQPLVYGRHDEHCLRWTEDGTYATQSGHSTDAPVFDLNRLNLSQAFALSLLGEGQGPLPIGVFWQRSFPTYEEEARRDYSVGSENLRELFKGQQSWEVPTSPLPATRGES
jgi:2-oxoglutarate/2-oxoacid ferredoxin oxidoreductase subunit beta